MKYLISLAITICALAAHAQTEQSKTWTLEECMLYAVEHSPETNIQEARNNITQQEYIQAIGALLPSLSASTNANFNFGRSLGEDNIYVDANSFSNNYSASTNFTIFAGLRNINNLRLQRINRITGRHELQQKRDDVAYTTMEAFFNALYYKEMVILAESQLEESRLNLLQTERMEELGIKGFPDVAEMRAQEATNSYRLTDWKNRLTIGIIVLKQQMNYPIDANLDIASYDMETEVAKTHLTAAGIYRQALNYLPRALAANSSTSASEINLKIARGQRYPVVSAGASYGTGFYRNLGGEYDSFTDQFRGKRNYSAGVSLSIPIFNGFSTSANIRRTKYSLDIARIQRDNALRTIYADIEQAVADMNGGADQYAQAVRQRENRAVAHNVNQRKYEEGLVSALELHTSSSLLVQARAEELDSRLKYILKKRMVDYYSGVPFIFAETETASKN